MIIKSVFVKEISQRIRILQAQQKKDIAEELAGLTTSVTLLSYKAWVIESFILGINKIFGSILEKTGGNANSLIPIKDALFEAVLKINPLLDPENLYISSSNTITLTKQPVKLTECETWKFKEENSNLFAFNIEDYYKITENARKHDHYTEVVSWDLVPDTHVTVRQYQKKLKTELMQGFSPKSEDEVKYFVVVSCIDNIQSLFQYLAYVTQEINLPYEKILNSLYDLALEHNPFLKKIKVRDFTKVNSNVRYYKEGTQEQVEDKRARKSLLEIPKREIVNLFDNISSKVFGQDEAIRAICNSVRKAYNGLKNPKTPIGSFFLYGPTSTGKTELAKVVAKALTRSPQGLVKISCNTLTSSHNVHTLIGAPPGYVGFEEKGLLANALEKNQFKVILFDEVEKAHPKLFDIVLEMLEEGEIMMADGEIVNVSQCLILFTSNMGQEEANNALNPTGFISGTSEEEKDEIQKDLFLKTLTEKLKPEFRARIAGMYYFPRLQETDLIRIASAKLSDYVKLLARKKIQVSFGRNIPEFVVKKCRDSNTRCHARDVRNFIDMFIVEKLGDFILQNLDKGKKSDRSIEVRLEDKELTFNFKDLPNEKAKAK